MREPLVTVLTPVYNGETYLPNCVESVCAQEYENWEYIIINNCSSDKTLEIAESYANQDKRIRIHNNNRFVDVIQNHNIALQLISAKSEYFKIVHADDIILPQCISSMVDVAERNPKTGIISSYVLVNNDNHNSNVASSKVMCEGIPYPTAIISGKDACRNTLLKGNFTTFGPPSAALIRSNLVRNGIAHYDESMLFADMDICFRILSKYDLGFVHQILSVLRVHSASQSASVGSKYNMPIVEYLKLLLTYGSDIFSKDEYEHLLKKRFNEYYQYLGKSALKLRDKEFWSYHRNEVCNLGFRLSRARILYGMLSVVFNGILELRTSADKIRKIIRNSVPAARPGKSS